MTKNWLKMALLSILILFISACSETNGSVDSEKIKGRWYTQSQVDSGHQVYEKNCLECHGTNAQGISFNWRKTLPDGSYPPPPLNGSAHAWHHPMKLLKRTINKGGIPIGGKMPAFEKVLDEQEKLSAIAYFQNFWNDKIYKMWLERGGLK